MALPFDGYEVEAEMRPAARGHAFDLDKVLSSVLALEARIPPDAFTASALGTERLGNGVVISSNGLILTIGYLIMEADEIVLTLNDGRRVAGHALSTDPVSGFGLVQALEPLDLQPLSFGNSRSLAAGDPAIMAGSGGRSHAVAARVLARMPFAGYWEYLLDNAIITEPAHPHWSGAALIGPAGDLMGIGSLSLQRQTREGIEPINMVVPIDLLPPILDDLARGKPAQPPRPWLGVLAQDVGSRVIIVGVNPQGPAARAELRGGDAILAVGGVTVTDLEDFYTQLWAQGEAGAVIALRVQREDDVFDVEIRSADRMALMKKRRLN